MPIPTSEEMGDTSSLPALLTGASFASEPCSTETVAGVETDDWGDSDRWAETPPATLNKSIGPTSKAGPTRRPAFLIVETFFIFVISLLVELYVPLRECALAHRGRRAGQSDLEPIARSGFTIVFNLNSEHHLLTIDGCFAGEDDLVC